ncbi:hypothetical protein KL933_000767 [Ogataea haglerorum]|uniref:Major facilitator superfamily (MFS) profile domain-containing protein n=1 Tax=Ogataea haglerorum TaxID=1937702 RepID=A0AAN6D7V4_9ASCO|nr:hypothetical protein KL933_000767 [Ogataea haglerorum]
MGSLTEKNVDDTCYQIDSNTENAVDYNAKLFKSFAEQEEITLLMKENPSIARRVLWKVDLFIATNMFLIVFLEFLDKNSLGFAAVLGLKADTHLAGNDYSNLSSIFYYGYLLGEFISFFLIPKVRIGKFVSISLLVWGALLMCLAACQSFGSLCVVRFLLGVFEACILPAFMIIASLWWKKEEQPLRSTLYFNTLAGILGGIFAHLIGLIHGKLATWRILFLIYGAVTVVYAGFLVFLFPDNIENAIFLTPHEKQVAYLRVIKNHTGSSLHSDFKLYQIREALLDPKYYILLAFIICQAITNAGITNFNTLIIQGFGFSALKTTLMATPQAAIALVAGILVSVICFLVKNVRCVFWVLCSLVGLSGALIVMKVDSARHRDTALAGVYLMGFYNIPWTLMLALVSSNVSGSTKKTFMSVSVAVWYAVGNIIGPHLFKNSEAPSYPMGIKAMVASFAIMAFTGILYFCALFLENRSRRSSNAQDVDIVVDLHNAEDENYKDVTDGENKNFIYVY